MADFKHIRGVIFDMDGLMLDTERLFRRAYQQAAMEVGVDFPDELYAAMIGHRADSSQRIMREGLGADAPCEEIIEGARRHYYALLEKGGVPIRPGLLDTLDYLDEISLPRAVATSTHEGLSRSKLTATGLIKRLPVIVSGDQVPNGKPAPDIYLRAAELLGLAPEDCLVLEDSPTGLEGAYRAGMMPVLIPDLQTPTALMREQAAFIFPSLREFAAAFRQGREAQVTA
ncbi:HAD family phosphatase [Ruficoccus amylovorans]|uniref:HAD family phosphatase n=1 Tax=Ruficoccus amylovorans TaxID=1804625 RepID=A0A842HJU2_9BACT|nr:HAD family phosphatase [Ruficoccus amylovorans]MBC2596218.1 HAD family phosphatase [Ruficoccus amylovorans]